MKAAAVAVNTCAGEASTASLQQMVRMASSVGPSRAATVSARRPPPYPRIGTVLLLTSLAPGFRRFGVGAGGRLMPETEGGIVEWVKVEDLERMESYVDYGVDPSAPQGEEAFDIF